LKKLGRTAAGWRVILMRGSSNGRPESSRHAQCLPS
jgi:hypothetical protein